jgi:hypothetical protein
VEESGRGLVLGSPVRPVASRYTDWAIPAHTFFKASSKIRMWLEQKDVTYEIKR